MAPSKLSDPSIRDAKEVASILLTDIKTGLTAHEAARRLAAYGFNELRSTFPVPRWRRVLKQFQDPLIYLLLGAAAISLLAWLIPSGLSIYRAKRPR